MGVVLVYPQPAEHKKFKPNMVPPITPELSRLRQKGHKSVANLVYTERKKLFDIPFRRKKFVLECVCLCTRARMRALKVTELTEYIYEGFVRLAYTYSPGNPTISDSHWRA